MSRISAEIQGLISQALKNKHFANALLKGSGNNKQLANERIKQFANMLENARAYSSAQKLFSTTNFNNLGTVLNLSSLMAIVTSFSGFLSVERAIEQPRIAQYFLNLVSSSDPTVNFPVVGPTGYGDNTLANQTIRGTISSSTFNLTSTMLGISHPIIPGTISLKITAYDTSNNVIAEYEITDNAQGDFLIPSSISVGATTVLSYGTNTPVLTPATFTLTFGPTAAASYSYTLSFAYAFVDVPSYPALGNDTRFKLDLTRTVLVQTKASTLQTEISLVEMAQLQKSLNVDLMSIMTYKITEMYSKIINRYIAQVFINNFPTNEVVIDLVTPIVTGLAPVSGWNQYLPILDKLLAELEAVHIELARKSFVGLRPTAYIVSPRLYSYFRRMRIIENSIWMDEETNYINNLVGYLNGIPVLVHTDLAVFDTSEIRNINVDSTNTVSATMYNAAGYAVHVRPDASLGPTLHAVYLPPTPTPNVGNFNNTIMQAMGLFYQSETMPLAPELVVGFTVRGLPMP